MKFRQLEHQELSGPGKVLPLCLICEAVQVPDNVGMIFRLAEAFGAERIFLTAGSIAPPNQKILKVSRKTVNTIDFEVAASATDVIGRLKKDGYFITGLEITTASIPIREFNFREKDKIALVVGSEKHGISPQTLRQLDACVSIPLLGKTSSLNVATALAIAIYETVSQWSTDVNP